jgi:hypothetical protein
MPGKSRHGKGRHPHYSKKSRAKQRQGATVLPQHVISDTSRPVTTASTPPPSDASSSPAKPKAIQYPYITSELRSIGILAGIIIVILIVLAQILS